MTTRGYLQRSAMLVSPPPRQVPMFSHSPWTWIKLIFQQWLFFSWCLFVPKSLFECFCRLPQANKDFQTRLDDMVASGLWCKYVAFVHLLVTLLLPANLCGAKAINELEKAWKNFDGFISCTARTCKANDPNALHWLHRSRNASPQCISLNLWGSCPLQTSWNSGCFLDKTGQDFTKNNTLTTQTLYYIDKCGLILTTGVVNIGSDGGCHGPSPVQKHRGMPPKSRLYKQ